MTDMTINEAVAETRKFGRMLKGVERLVDVANALEGADQAVADRRRQEAEVLARVAAATAKFEDLEIRNVLTAQAIAEAKTSAETKAAEMLNAARTEASSIVAAARTEEQEARDAASGVIARAAAAERALKNAQVELAEVQARLEKAKAEARKIFAS